MAGHPVATVDVVIPCYNYGRYLPACVQSVLSQPGVSVRAIVIDDASSDSSADVAAKMSAADSRIKFIRHTANKGHIATYNEGLEMASSEYVVLLSADDLLAPGALARATGLMDRHPSVGFVYGYPYCFEDNEKIVPAKPWLPASKIWPGRTWIEYMCKSGRNFIHSPEVVMRTSVQRKTGGYNTALPHSGDMEMWLRAASISDVGRVNGVEQAYYRYHRSNMHRTAQSGVLVDLRGRQNAFRSALDDPKNPLPGAKKLLEVANKSLAVVALGFARQANESGEATAEQVGGLLEFARSAYPKIENDWRWRAEVRRVGKKPGTVAKLMNFGRAHARRYLYKVLWRIWRRTGIWHGAMP
jgi:glycosyltransferase involved in cell wall biosynthesis